ncbi:MULTISPECIES: ketohydroxyglutarate aldolase [Lactobacillus]|uniref:ketohydroxyglutarate aldolase n=1 Tax=Lactobacillus TaxID=1578 RepID=UPI001C6A7465|nr:MULTISPECIES: ketohydroxyglutarate aldolase [Lactobacillus]MCX8722591.1 ketohydroxyglutarate aldolase [Lactobacillus sp. B4005]QYN56344.1 ketohydroxyglutarate aldolase [Lactobacillus panisapium]
MRKFDYLKQILDSCALAVVRAPKKRVLEIAKGIHQGGINVMEVSYTNNDAPLAIDLVHENFGDQVLVGAGTILDPQTARDAISHDAGFLYSPIFDQDVAALANEYQIPYAAGCTTVTEAVSAMRAGASFIKMFPYSGIEGPKVIETIKTPIPWMPVLQSGAVTEANVDQWLDAGAEVLGIGSALTKGSIADISDHACKIRQAIERYRQEK